MPSLPPRVPTPVLDGAACRRYLTPAAWFSDSPAERQAARTVCLTACPVLAQCREWALSTPRYSDAGHIVGGMTPAERERRRKAAKAKAAARREAQRCYGRECERRRRMLGKAPTTAQRYAKDPEPFKEQARAYYVAHAEQVKARRRARYAARKAAQQAA